MNSGNNCDNCYRRSSGSTIWWQVFDSRQTTKGRFERSRLAACAALLAVACLSFACNRNKSIITVPTESDAVEILDLLAENGVDADAEQVGEETKQWSVMVAESRFGGSEVAQARRLLQDNGLPRPVAKGLDGGSGIVKPESLQKAQLLGEQKAEIERQLRQLPGVIRASVGVAPAEDSFRINPAPRPRPC